MYSIFTFYLYIPLGDTDVLVEDEYISLFKISLVVLRISPKYFLRQYTESLKGKDRPLLSCSSVLRAEFLILISALVQTSI